MNLQQLKQTAFIGDAYLRGPIRGIVMVFHGLGSAGMKEGLESNELEWAGRGGLIVFPYTGPWHWSLGPVRAFIDDVIGSVREHYCGGRDVPIVLTGGSLGGHTALIYARYSRHRLAGCMVNCPVGDVEFSFNERPDVPRTILAAANWKTESLPALFRELSPLHQVEHMPDIPYLIIHGAKDTAVAKAAHSDPLVPKMRARGLKVEFIEAQQMGHCGPFTYEIHRKWVDFVLKLLE